MINSNTQEKISNILFSCFVVLGIYAAGAYFFDFFYDLNDDMVIKDILSGAYYGIPDGHTNQMLYPIGFLLGCVYRLLPDAPVLGIFFCFCFSLCFAMITYRITGFFKSNKLKITTVLLMILIFLSLMIWELIYVQYSVVCGCLSAAACFWFYTTPAECEPKEFWKKSFPALLLVWLAFMIRSEMLLLTAPFLAVAGSLHWAEAVKIEKDNHNEIGIKKEWQYVFSKNNVLKYITFAAVLIIGLATLLGMDSLAYQGQDWQEYRRFFDARTKVYDFTWYPDYEEQKGFYDENDINEIQYRLIDNYNFGLDESIDENTLEKIASYGEKSIMLGSTAYRIKTTLWEMGDRLFSLEEAPYNYFVLAGYVLAVGLAVLKKEKKYVWKLMLLFFMRCIPWFYLIYVQRAVIRITHSLYIAEFVLLLAILVKELYDRPLWNAEKYYRMAAAGVLALIALLSLPMGVSKVKAEQSRREQVLVNQNLLDDYAKANPENYYYLDVYSTVSFVEKMFADVDDSRKNYDLMGGWFYKSPLQKENMLRFTDSTAMEEALLKENVYFVAEKDAEVSFIEDYYETKNKNVLLELQDTVGEGENPFHIYKVTEDVKEKRNKNDR